VRRQVRLQLRLPRPQLRPLGGVLAARRLQLPAQRRALALPPLLLLVQRARRPAHRLEQRRLLLQHARRALLHLRLQ
jgi:hypothetical protein